MTMDFTRSTDDEIIDFVTAHTHFFAESFKENFGRDTKYGIRTGDVVVIRRPEGFAILETGHPDEGGWGRPATLLIIYVATEHRGSKISRSLIEQVKAAAVPGVVINLICEGERRRVLFQQNQFSVIDDFCGSGTYKMQYDPHREWARQEP